MISSIKYLYIHPYNKQRPIFAFFRWILWKLIKIFKFKQLKVKVWGNRFLQLNYDSFQSMWIMYNWIVDWEEFQLIEHYIEKNDIVFDIGTNMGFYTLWMSRFIDKYGEIHCFEPDKQNYSRLQTNISLNQIESIIKTNRCAVSDSDGLVKFTEGRDGENHISNIALDSAVEVQSITLDTYFEFHGIQHIAYMKIDVEGFELQALKGAKKLLKNKKVDIIQLEINQQLNNAGTKVNDLLFFLENYGYNLYCYETVTRCLNPVQYTQERENYFAIADILKVNKRIR
jgi:FkbM family methyltransferase